MTKINRPHFLGGFLKSILELNKNPITNSFIPSWGFAWYGRYGKFDTFTDCILIVTFN